MITISWYDSDPYTGINILEDGVVKRREHVPFTYKSFTEFIEKEEFVAATVDEMSDKITEFELINQKMAVECARKVLSWDDKLETQ